MQERTDTQLAAELMTEVRKHPQCNHIISVAIARPVQQALHQPNWYPEWLVDGPANTPPIASEIARRMQSQFRLTDLASA